MVTCRSITGQFLACSKHPYLVHGIIRALKANYYTDTENNVNFDAKSLSSKRAKFNDVQFF